MISAEHTLSCRLDAFEEVGAIQAKARFGWLAGANPMIEALTLSLPFCITSAVPVLAKRRIDTLLKSLMNTIEIIMIAVDA